MAEIIIVGCTWACFNALAYNSIQESENERKKNIAEYIRLYTAIFEKCEEIKKMNYDEIKELEQKFIYEYPNISMDARKDLSQKLVKIKYLWFEDNNTNNIKNMLSMIDNIRNKISSDDIYYIYKVHKINDLNLSDIKIKLALDRMI